MLGRWMRMFTIPNQSSVPRAYTQFTDELAESSEDYVLKEGGSRLMPSGNRDRLVDCMEEFVKYTVVMRPHFDLFGDRFSERAEKVEKLRKLEAAKAAEKKAEEELKAITNGVNGTASNPPENPNA
jgi:arsenic resistance protein ArsH